METCVQFDIGGVIVESEWRDTPTAKKLIAALPMTVNGSYWGAEIYFNTPVTAAAEPDSTDVVEPGTVAFWLEGSCLCLFWGPTPASRGNECRAASRVNIVGRVTNPDVLPRLKARAVKVTLA